MCYESHSTICRFWSVQWISYHFRMHMGAIKSISHATIMIWVYNKGCYTSAQVLSYCEECSKCYVCPVRSEVSGQATHWPDEQIGKFFSRPSPKAGRELQTVSDMMRRRDEDEDPWRSRSRSPGRESTQRLCTCFKFR